MKWLALFFALVAGAAWIWYVMQPVAVFTDAKNSDVTELPDDAIIKVSLSASLSG